jgi:uncharacterized lipoprotein YmbA
MKNGDGMVSQKAAEDSRTPKPRGHSRVREWATSLKRGVNETLKLQLATCNPSNLLTPKRKLSLLTRFWRWTVELGEITNSNLQQTN